MWHEIILLLVEEVVAQRDCSKQSNNGLLLKAVFSVYCIVILEVSAGPD